MHSFMPKCFCGHYINHAQFSLVAHVVFDDYCIRRRRCVGTQSTSCINMVDAVVDCSLVTLYRDFFAACRHDENKLCKIAF